MNYLNDMGRGYNVVSHPRPSEALPFKLVSGNQPDSTDESAKPIVHSHLNKNAKSTTVCMYSFLEMNKTPLLSRFINFLTKKGKKSKAESLFYKSFRILSQIQMSEISSKQRLTQGQYQTETSQKNTYKVFEEAISNIQPFFEVKKVRIAGTTYQVPALIPQKRQENIAMNWLLESARERKKKNSSQNFENCLALEIREAFQKQGQARQKRNDLHKLAEANRAFSHFRWW